MAIQKRNIGLYVVLTILTCGIFGLYWMVCLQDETNYLTDNKGEQSGGIVLLLNIVTCGIYGVYWCFRQGEKLEKYYAEQGLGEVSSNQNLSILYLILAVCNYFAGVTTLIAYALMQEKLNQIIDSKQPVYSCEAPQAQTPVAEPVTEPVKAEPVVEEVPMAIPVTNEENAAEE